MFSLACRAQIHVLGDVTITGKVSTQLTNGHFYCLVKGCNRLRRSLTWPAGEQDILDDLRDEPMLSFHSNLSAVTRHVQPTARAIKISHTYPLHSSRADSRRLSLNRISETIAKH